MSVRLLQQKSFNLRKLLIENDFIIFTFNEVTGQLDLDRQDYSDKVVLLRDPTIKYECIYNGEKPPDQTVFKELEENDELVLSYSFEKRQ